MRRVRQRDTGPEVRVRQLLRSANVYYRLCPRDLPGRPDLANKKDRWAIFVHGCFWHAHAGCRLATVPKTNRDFWIEKFAANRKRDSKKARELAELGYKVAVVWQCELEDPRLLPRLLRQIGRRRTPARS